MTMPAPLVPAAAPSLLQLLLLVKPLLLAPLRAARGSTPVDPSSRTHTWCA
jgi:hypothetical protein